MNSDISIGAALKLNDGMASIIPRTGGYTPINYVYTCFDEKLRHIFCLKV